MNGLSVMSEESLIHFLRKGATLLAEKDDWNQSPKIFPVALILHILWWITKISKCYRLQAENLRQLSYENNEKIIFVFKLF